MRTYSKTLLASALLLGLAGGAFADTYSSGSSSVVTTGPRVSSPMAMAPAASPGAINDPQTIRSCLCMQAQYQNQATAVMTKQASYSQAVSQKSTLDGMVANAKTGAAPEQVAQVRQASENSIMLNNQINNALLPDLQNATAQYNQSVAAFDQSCGGKSYNADVLAQVKNGLTCPGG